MSLNIWTVRVGMASLLSVFGAVDTLAGSVDEHDRCGESSACDVLLEPIAESLLPMMPAEQREMIISKGGIGSENFQLDKKVEFVPYNGEETVSQWLEGTLEELDDIEFTELQVRTMRNMADAIDNEVEVPPACYAPGTDPVYILLMDEMVYRINPIAFQQNPRWQSTAISGAGLQQGDPTVITYSFVADGTFIPNGGFGSGNSQLFAWLNSIYGSPAVWQDLFAQVFDRWEDLIGTSYVFEANDDGVSMSSAFGLAGVRGDVRIGAMQLDGNSGVLAYNNFPENGDMVFDAFDSFYNSTGGNSLRLRNVTAHEHGHGLGMLHICPLDGRWLMEPIFAAGFDGPQLDDILNGHRHYGDPMEPNDSSFVATDLGGFDSTTTEFIENVSLDSINDRDFYKITMTEPGIIVFRTTPDADAYLNGFQSADGDEDMAFCVDGNTVNYNGRQDLGIRVYNSDDFVTPLLSVSNGFLGQSDEMVFSAIESRDYWFEVFSVVGSNDVQRYNIDISTSFLLEFGGDTPQFLEPGIENSFTISINPFEQTILSGSAQLFYRLAGEQQYSSTPLVENKGFEYIATLPGFDCDPDGVVEYYFEATVIGTGAVFTFPAGGDDDPLEAFIGSPSPFFTDSFESSQGWSVSGDVSGQNAGEWERGVPAGDGTRGEPIIDADGSGSCYLTGNGGPGSNTDVDNGQTILNSPIFDLSDIVRPSVSYYRWYDNTGSGLGSGASEDVFIVEVSDDGGLNWFSLETVGPNTVDSQGDWYFREFDITTAMSGVPDFDLSTSQFQIRFIAEDLVNASVIEAGVDGVSVQELVCTDPQPVISLAGDPGRSALPGEDFVFDVVIDEPIDSVVPGSAVVRYFAAGSLGRGGFESAELVFNGGNSYTATIPAQDCNPNNDKLPDGASDVSYFIEVEGVTTGITTFPDIEEEDLLGFNIGDPMLILEDSFELDTGWTVSGGAKSALDGMWERGVPQGDGTSGDPTVDGDGSGSCYLTGNTEGMINSDVDGQTTLTSPIFDVSGLVAPRMIFYRWYDNTGGGAGPAQGSDVMEISVSYDGGEFYETLSVVGPNNADSIGGWIQDELRLDQEGTPTSTMRVRFNVTDMLPGSIVEAGIDGVVISGLACDPLCPQDLNGDGELDFFDVSAFLTAFGSGDPSADFSGDGQFDFFDVSAFLSAFAAGCP